MRFCLSLLQLSAVVEKKDLNRRRGGRARSDGLGKVRDDLSQQSILYTVHMYIHCTVIVWHLRSFWEAPNHHVKGGWKFRAKSNILQFLRHYVTMLSLISFQNCGIQNLICFFLSKAFRNQNMCCFGRKRQGGRGFLPINIFLYRK